MINKQLSEVTNLLESHNRAAKSRISILTQIGTSVLVPNKRRASAICADKAAGNLQQMVQELPQNGHANGVPPGSPVFNPVQLMKMRTDNISIDLRSDTVTRPTDAMREACANAVVGDDVYGEDPTVNELQRVAAEMLGKEAAILVSSGTMGNLAALLAHCEQRGSEIILGDESHIYHYEAGGVSVLGGIAFNLLPNLPNGEIPLAKLKKAIRERLDRLAIARFEQGYNNAPNGLTTASSLRLNLPIDEHFARTSCICLENTQNRCGGKVLSLEYMAQVKEFADSKGIPVHLDGARVFNAAEALGVPVSEITKHVTTVQICLSKGLGAPCGSIVAGPAAFISKVLSIRKMLGGGMRQSGIIAAPGILAMTEMSRRLDIDHRNAQVLARGMAKLKLIDLNPEDVHSNIIVFRIKPEAHLSPAAFAVALQKKGVMMVPFVEGTVRAVTHVDFDGKQISSVVSKVAEVLNEGAQQAVNGHSDAVKSPYGDW